MRPKEQTRVWQNEYSVWLIEDKHSQAYAALTKPVALRMADLLGLARATEAAECLNCHALNVPSSQRARTFDLNEGVSCESCHGPAMEWLGPHTARDWTHEMSVAKGMNDTKNLVRRAEVCLSCHLGSERGSVNHEMIAAGHPDLIFELDTFSAAMPRHWREPLEEEPWWTVRAWATGQAIQLREALNLLAHRAQEGPVWPEYAEQDCFACHHELTAPEDSWRQKQGYPGRRPGRSPWNASRFAIFRELAQRVNPDVSASLEAEIGKLNELMSQPQPDRNAVNSSALQAVQLTKTLSRDVVSVRFDRFLVLHLLRRIADADDSIPFQGRQVAEQTVLALDSLTDAYLRNVPGDNQQEIREVVKALFQQLEAPAGYNPARYAQELRRLRSLLR